MLQWSFSLAGTGWTVSAQLNKTSPVKCICFSVQTQPLHEVNTALSFRTVWLRVSLPWTSVSQVPERSEKTEKAYALVNSHTCSFLRQTVT